jgi:hypothetical protein
VLVPYLSLIIVGSIMLVMQIARRLLLLLVMLSSLIISPIQPTEAFAHSGRTDSSGGHNCRVGSCAGTYHFHNQTGKIEIPKTTVTPRTTESIPKTTVAPQTNSWMERPGFFGEGKSIRDNAVAIFWVAVLLGFMVWLLVTWSNSKRKG